MKVSFVILLILLIGLFIFTFYRSIIYSPNTHTQENFIADFDNVMDNYCKLNFENRHNYIGPWDKKELVGCDFEACSLGKCWYLNPIRPRPLSAGGWGGGGRFVAVCCFCCRLYG